MKTNRLANIPSVQLSALLFTAFVGCGAKEAAHPVVEDVPFVFAKLADVHPDFSVRQHVAWSAHGRSGSFDAVLQKQGSELVLIGLGPMSVRAFVLRQSDTNFSFDQSLGPKLPFPPKNIAVDIHRAFFKGVLAEAKKDGQLEGVRDGEKITETWQGGELRARRFVSIETAEKPSEVVVGYGSGCTHDRCTPASVKIQNARIGYQLEITSDAYEILETATADRTAKGSAVSVSNESSSK